MGALHLALGLGVPDAPHDVLDPVGLAELVELGLALPAGDGVELRPVVGEDLVGLAAFVDDLLQELDDHLGGGVLDDPVGQDLAGAVVEDPDGLEIVPENVPRLVICLDQRQAPWALESPVDLVHMALLGDSEKIR